VNKGRRKEDKIKAAVESGQASFEKEAFQFMQVVLSEHGYTQGQQCKICKAVRRFRKVLRDAGEVKLPKHKAETTI
jgi:hypothetical protein